MRLPTFKTPGCAIVCAALFLFTSPAVLHANTWFVGGTNPDFLDIQPAIDAASHGDLILVRPGTYSVFTLDKGVMVRASNVPFDVTGTVLVNGIGSGRRGGVSGMTLAGLLDVSSCDGEVVLENLGLWTLEISACDNCCGTGIRVNNPVPGDYRNEGALWIQYSSVRLSDVQVYGGDGLYGGEQDGQTAVRAESSLVVLSAAILQGGEGGDTVAGNGGDGGNGIYALNSTVHLHGDGSQTVRGGRGGDGGLLFGDGGDGGTGFFTTTTSFASRVVVYGGLGGSGNPDGWDGANYMGPIQTPTDYALLEIDDYSTLNPGGKVTMNIDAANQGAVLLMLADSTTFSTSPYFGGPPLSASPWYLKLFLGRTDGAGDMKLTTFLPNDTSLRGVVLTVQALVFGDDVLTNCVTRVVGE